MKKLYVVLMMCTVLHCSDVLVDDHISQEEKIAAINVQKEILNKKLSKSSKSIFSWVAYYRAWAKLDEIPESEFFMNLADSFIMDNNSLLQTTQEEQECVQDLHDFYEDLSLIDDFDEQEIVMGKFARRYQEISIILAAMYERFDAMK